MDYAKIQLKAGLEIHQQLDTGKLFSRTPSFLRKDPPHFTISRRLHKVAGETGEVDAAVEHEASLKKEFIYEGYNDTISLVELDESPPQKIDEEALDEAIKIALLLNCEIYQHSQIMRKTVIDGSNTSGFQRTVIIAHDGFLETSFGKVGIETVVLEEDSARIISKDSKKSIYRLDRLGIPLIEIATAPDMHTPEQIKETALKLGEILRACKVKRGIGTIRQDVNISIKGHERVEIKGFQDPSMFIKTVDLEIERQLEEIKNKKINSERSELHQISSAKREQFVKKAGDFAEASARSEIKGEVRNALPDGRTEFLRPMPGKARMYPETDLPLLKIPREKINELKKKLPKLKTDIRSELEKKGVSPELIDLAIENLEEFTTLSKVYCKDSNLVAKMISVWRNDIATKLKISKEKISDILTERILEQILEVLVKKQIEQSDIKAIMEKIAKGEKFEDAIKIEKVSHDELEEEISKIVKEKPGLRPNAYMGLVMQKFKGKLDAKKAMEIIEKFI